LTVELIGEHLVTPIDQSRDCARIGINQELEFIEAMTFLRCIESMHTVAVELTAAHVRQKAMPDPVSNLSKPHSSVFLDIFGTSEQAELDAGGVFREQGEVRSLSRNFGA
jgi:hypothetical protein